MGVNDWLNQAIHGPGHLRFVIQPLVAMVLGHRDGLVDARAGKPPYFLSLFTSEGQRVSLAKNGLTQITVPLMVGVIVDALVQLIVLRTIHPVAALKVGVLLIALPYASARGIFNRVARVRSQRHA